jgi:hypothetical protein
VRKTGKSRIGAVLAMGAVLFAGAVTTAPSASAVGSSACSKNVTNHWRHIDVLAGDWPHTTYLRTGPGSDYSAKRGLDYGDDFKAYCTAYSHSGKIWYYSKMPSGQKGWVYGYFSAKGTF